jgi:hypothetical protein
MDPTIWGPPLWYQMHMKTFAFNPKKSDKQKIIQYFENIKNNLPCENCKVHFANYLLKRPLKFYLNDKSGLINWLIDMHNEVNARLGKKILSYNEARKIYEKPKNTNNIFLLFLLFLIILVFLKTKNFF